MLDLDYQGIYDIIADTLPGDWDRVILYCLSWSGSSEVSYYVKYKNGDIKDCYKLGVPDDIMLNKTISLLSLICKGDYQWKSLTLIIDSDGSFDAKADYTSNIEDTGNYLKSWSEQYLR